MAAGHAIGSELVATRRHALGNRQHRGHDAVGICWDGAELGVEAERHVLLGVEVFADYGDLVTGVDLSGVERQLIGALLTVAVSIPAVTIAVLIVGSFALVAAAFVFVGAFSAAVFIVPILDLFGGDDRESARGRRPALADSLQYTATGLGVFGNDHLTADPAVIVSSGRGLNDAVYAEIDTLAGVVMFTGDNHSASGLHLRVLDRDRGGTRLVLIVVLRLVDVSLVLDLQLFSIRVTVAFIGSIID